MKLWNYISELGIDEHLKKTDIRLTQLINRLIFISGLIAIIYLPLLFWLKAFWMFGQLSSFIIVIFSFLLVPTQFKIKFAVPTIGLMMIYHMTSVSIYIQNSQLELYIILITLIQFAVIRNQILSFSIFFIGIASYFISLFFQETTDSYIIMSNFQKIIMIAFNAVGIFIGGLYLIFQVKNSNTKHQIEILTERKKVLNRNKKIERQVEIIAETNKEITDSINYSKRIQNAILPSSNKIKTLLPNSFVIYKPKDIVAGDFYWVEQTNNHTHFAVADCTGHGVPGAMMSVVCTNALNRSLKEYDLLKPSEILNKTREIVLHDLDASEDNIKDGMDIGLCSIVGNILNYSGANIKLYLLRENNIIEYKANKQPIGLYIGNQTEYTNHEIELKNNDCIYLVTDGYVDQFGGEKMKKFKTPALKELLLTIYQLPIELQKSKMISNFESWKNDLEQIDDVCVMGIKFNI